MRKSEKYTYTKRLCIGGAESNTEFPSTGLDFSKADVNTEAGASVAVGIIVDEADYINADDGGYTTTVTWKAVLSSVE